MGAERHIDFYLDEQNTTTNCEGPQLPNIKTSSQQPPSSIASSATGSEYKECANCGVNDTPLWRKYNDHDLCNACGIYFRVNGFHRPFLPNMRKLLSSARKMGLSCVNCSTKITSMWRRTPEGESICNACGLYYRLNGVKRPVSMRKDWIRKRQRKTQQISGIMRLANQTILSTSVGEQQQLQQQIGSANSISGVSQQQQQQQQPPLQPQPASSSFESNHHQQLNHQLSQSQSFQLVNGGVHEICSNEVMQNQQNQQSTQNENQYHQKTFDYSLQYYDFGQTVTFQQQQQQLSEHHHELQPMMNSSSSLSGQVYMHQHNSSATLVHSYNEVPVECTNGGVYSSCYHHQEDIKEVHHHHQQNGHHHHHQQ